MIWIVLILAIFTWSVIDRICECIENKKREKETILEIKKED